MKYTIRLEYFKIIEGGKRKLEKTVEDSLEEHKNLPDTSVMLLSIPEKYIREGPGTEEENRSDIRTEYALVDGKKLPRKVEIENAVSGRGMTAEIIPSFRD